MGELVVISGPVGVGKSTVSRALLEISAAPVAYVEGDDFWRFLAKPAPGRPHRRNAQTIMRAMFRAAAALAVDDYTAILDFTLPLDFVRAAAGRLEPTPVSYVELRASVETCATRAATRAEGVIADYGPYADLLEVFTADDHAVVVDQLAPSDAAAAIRAGLDEGRFRLK